MKIKLEDQQVERMIGAGYNQAWDINTIEMNYKFLARWYWTPERTHKYKMDGSLSAGETVNKMPQWHIYGGIVQKKKNSGRK